MTRAAWSPVSLGMSCFCGDVRQGSAARNTNKTSLYPVQKDQIECFLSEGFHCLYSVGGRHQHMRSAVQKRSQHKQIAWFILYSSAAQILDCGQREQENRRTHIGIQDPQTSGSVDCERSASCQHRELHVEGDSRTGVGDREPTVHHSPQLFRNVEHCEN
jgi:hypothetical protein